jgi:hypothetical protein
MLPDCLFDEAAAAAFAGNLLDLHQQMDGLGGNGYEPSP